MGTPGHTGAWLGAGESTGLEANGTGLKAQLLHTILQWELGEDIWSPELQFSFLNAHSVYMRLHTGST